MMNEAGKPYLIVTKGTGVLTRPEYLAALDKGLAHIQVSISSTDDAFAKTYEVGAQTSSSRIADYHKLEDLGYDVALRVSPYMLGHVDWAKLGGHKLLVEFLRVNSWILKWMPVDLSDYELKSGGYRHLPLERKIEELDKASGFDQVSVCEDVDEHYEYWKANVNANKDDCCNLSLTRL